jgi:hypothetical protein
MHSEREFDEKMTSLHFRAGQKVRVPHRVDIDQLHSEIAASTARRSMVQ